jgi:hypothetical protein
MPETSQRRLVKSAIIRARWPEIDAALGAGRCLHDIWLDWRDDLQISYRQFTRALAGFPQTRYAASRTARPAMKKETLPPVPKDAKFDRFQNLRQHENRQETLEYKGTRPADELI